MKGKVKVVVFGISRDPQTGLNALPLKKYFSLVKYLEGSDVTGNVDLQFIDAKEKAMSNYPAVQKVLQQGRPLPVVAINGVVKYFGDIPYESVYQDIKQMLARG